MLKTGFANVVKTDTINISSNLILFGISLYFCLNDIRITRRLGQMMLIGVH